MHDCLPSLPQDSGDRHRPVQPPFPSMPGISALTDHCQLGCQPVNAPPPMLPLPGAALGSMGPSASTLVQLGL